VSSLDRPGLLYELTRSISDLALNIASAHVATFGERAVDVFYVTDLTRQKVQSSSKQTAIRKRILQALDEAGEGKAGEGKSAEGKTAKKPG